MRKREIVGELRKFDVLDVALFQDWCSMVIRKKAKNGGTKNVYTIYGSFGRSVWMYTNVCKQNGQQCVDVSK